jgi:hypothetical protein
MTDFPDQGVYFWGTTEPFDSVTGSPPEWFQDSFDSWGGVDLPFISTESWQTSRGGPWVFPGQTLSGFELVDQSVEVPTSIAFFADSFGPVTPYTGIGNLGGDPNNPEFAGIAYLTPSQVPVEEPRSWPIMLAGIFGIGFMLRRLRRKDAVPAV